MKKFLSIAITSIFLFSSFAENSDREVYICKGPGSKKYHYNSNCRGLKNCSTDIYKVPKSEAQRMGRGLCGYE